MKIQQVIALINQMQADGVIERYAIGGAVGATFYLEPVATLDVDIFVALAPQPGQFLWTLNPIFDYLTARGGRVEGEYIVIADWPVQFLPPANPLVEEALREAVKHEVEGIFAFVFSPEHLAVIALQTGRAKDKARLLQFLEENTVNRENLDEIIQRHNLTEKWQRFEQQFLSE